MMRIDAIYLACGAADLRAGMDTLLARVVHSFEVGAQPHTAYVFANRSASRLKMLLMNSCSLKNPKRKAVLKTRPAPQAPAASSVKPNARPCQANSSAPCTTTRSSPPCAAQGIP